MNTQPQIIERDGKPEYAVVPYDDYIQLLEVSENFADAVAYDKAMQELDRGEDELIPVEIAHRLLSDKEHPLKIWREYRGLTQEALADQADTTKSYISQIEAGKKPGSVAVLKRLAAALNVDIDDLVRE
ncbi:MAG: helix-turn-helix transcriptional regulator [Pseudomonadota bacterium]